MKMKLLIDPNKLFPPRYGPETLNNSERKKFLIFMKIPAQTLNIELNVHRWVIKLQMGTLKICPPSG